MSWQKLPEVDDREVGRRIRDVLATTADKLRDEGFQIGFVRGQRASLLLLLNKR